MDKSYRESEIRTILQRELSTSPQVEQKIQEAYGYIRKEAAKISHTGTAIHPFPVKSAVSAGQPVPDRGRPARKVRRFLAPVAAAAILLAASVTVVAAINGFFTRATTQNDDAIAYEFQINYELTPYAVTVTPHYIPEGYQESEPGSLRYDKDGLGQNGISLSVITADHLAYDQETLDVSSVRELEHTTINDMEADLITLDYDTERTSRTFDKRIYLFNQAEGFVGVLYGGNDLSMEELTKVAENLEFTVTDQELTYEDTETVQAEQQADADAAALEEQRLQEKWESGVPSGQIYQIGETFTWGTEEDQTSVSVLDAQICDSVSDLPVENFFDYATIQNLLDTDGTLKPYERVSGTIPSYGEHTETSRELADQKFVKITLRAENLTDSTLDFWAGAPFLTWLGAEENGSFPYADTYTEPLNSQEYPLAEKDSPIYFDQSPFAGTMDSHFFYRELAPSEALEYTLVFVVDADRTENLYLNFGGQMSTDPEHEADYEKYVKLSF